MLTHDRVKELLQYDPESGELRWVKRYGKIAGGICLFNHTPRRKLRIDQKDYLASRVIWFWMTGKWPCEIDHINGKSDDDRWGNLREVTRVQNCHNAGKPRHNTSRVPGVVWHNRPQKWQARIGHEGRMISLRYYSDWFDAVCARKSAEHRLGFSPRHGR